MTMDEARLILNSRPQDSIEAVIKVGYVLYFVGLAVRISIISFACRNGSTPMLTANQSASNGFITLKDSY